MEASTAGHFRHRQPIFQFTLIGAILRRGTLQIHNPLR
jgi:hypothetical protein